MSSSCYVGALSARHALLELCQLVMLCWSFVSSSCFVRALSSFFIGALSARHAVLELCQLVMLCWSSFSSSCCVGALPALHALLELCRPWVGYLHLCSSCSSRLHAARAPHLLARPQLALEFCIMPLSSAARELMFEQDAAHRDFHTGKLPAPVLPRCRPRRMLIFAELTSWTALLLPSWSTALSFATAELDCFGAAELGCHAAAELEHCFELCHCRAGLLCCFVAAKLGDYFVTVELCDFFTELGGCFVAAELRDCFVINELDCLVPTELGDSFAKLGSCFVAAKLGDYFGTDELGGCFVATIKLELVLSHHGRYFQLR
ncbi:hypothetical protein SLEP1_g16576 [Rubroshorea leprosula]|uniref:Uncharacterized protein n=2 Tax=Rubroshorea leprosula TaxID=152421 RepID=A0AAV5IXB0_9ROSI|nr:hypothetical protein SLEP1_g16576 [Rubroshorea leprosula]